MPYRPPSLPWSQSIILFGWWGLYVPLLVFLPIFGLIQLSGPRPAGTEFLFLRVLLPAVAFGTIAFIVYRMRCDLAEYRRLRAERVAEEFEDDDDLDVDDEEFEESNAFDTEYGAGDDDDSDDWRR